MNLRDYQAEDVEAIFKEWDAARSTLYVAATGLGKTVVMAEVVRRMLPKRTIFLCHRGELIYQARETFLRAGIECSIEKADLAASTSLFSRSPVVLATVQTLLTGEIDRKRMTRFKPMDFGLLLYDESHHSVSPGNKFIVDYFTSGNPNLKILGVTATPQRSDEEALGKIFETVASVREIRFGIDNGWLVDVEQIFQTVAGLDYSHIRTTAGDLNGADLSAVMESESNIQGVAHPTLEAIARLAPHALDSVPVEKWGEHIEQSRQNWRRAIVFTASVKQAETLCNIFNRVSPGIASWVCGKTPDGERFTVFEDFKSGKSSILVNVGVTTEGYDNPWVDLIVMARPTKSQLLYIQMAGRGTRVLPGLIEGLAGPQERMRAILGSPKPVLTVMDFAGNSGRHKMMTTADILGGNVSEDVIELAVRKAKEKGVPVNMTKELQDAEEELRKKLEAARLAEEARKARLVAKVRFVSRKVNPFDAFDLSPVRARGWNEGKKLSEKQRQLLMRQSLNPDDFSYEQGRQILIEMFRRWSGKLASMKQCDIIKKRHPEMDTKNLTQQQAGLMITEIANKEGWKTK
jgi:superfamily II DNA or RNA helicase